ncbi:MAG: hypothetical protein C0622_01140 [Desulfuromonas sp.]|nr:MAG: hypothetical protein C0622_01140 [Desulfuromonas sp.]
MAKQIRIQYELGEKDWRNFYNAYYSTDSRFKLRFLYGTLCWVVGTLGLIGLFDNKPIAFGMIAFGLYCVFAKQFMINKAIKTLKKTPGFPGVIDYQFDEKQISGTDRGTSFSFSWEEFHGYRVVTPGVMFYLKPASFFFIPDAAMKAEERQGILEILQSRQVNDLKIKAARKS